MAPLDEKQLTEIRQAAIEAAEQFRKAQGLPPKIEDAATIERIATIMRTPTR